MWALIGFGLVLFTTTYVASTNSSPPVIVSLAGAAAFDNFIDTTHFAFVEFRTPWCCDAFRPEYLKAAINLSAVVGVELTRPRVVCASIDASALENAAIRLRYGVTVFPTLLFFRGGRAIAFEDRDMMATAIALWAADQMLPRVNTETLVDLDGLLRFRAAAWAAGRAMIVVGTNDLSTAIVTSGGYALAVAMCTNATATALLLGNEQAPAGAAVFHAAIVRNFVQSKSCLDCEEDAHFLRPISIFTEPAGGGAAHDDVAQQQRRAAAVARWVRLHSRPLLADYSMQGRGASELFECGAEQIVVVLCDATETALLREVRAAARDLRGETLFIRVAPSEALLLHFFDLTPAELPAVRLVATTPVLERYALLLPASDDDIPFTASAIVGFYKEWSRGELSPIVKSEPSPPAVRKRSGAVTTLVGSTFWDVVLTPSLDVLVLFVAPWCAQCRKLEPTYTALGATYSAIDTVLITTMDAVANEPGGIEIEFFPTVMMWPAGADDAADAAVMALDGGSGALPAVEELVAFIRQNARAALPPQVIAPEPQPQHQPPSSLPSSFDGGDDDDEGTGAASPPFDADDSAVVELDAITMAEGVASPRIALVAFYDASCAHCAALAPEFAAAAAMLAEEELAHAGRLGGRSRQILLGKVDGSKHSELTTLHGVMAYPTLRFFKAGVEVEYDGGLSAEEIVAWVTVHASPAVRLLRTAARLRTFLDRNTLEVAAATRIVGFFDGIASFEEGQLLRDAFAALAEKLRYSHTFGLVDDVHIARSVTVNGAVPQMPCVHLVRRGGAGIEYSVLEPDVVNGTLTAEAIDAFVATNSLDVVYEFSDESAALVFHQDHLALHAVLVRNQAVAELDEISDDARAEAHFRDLAELYRGDAIFILVDSTDEANAGMMKFLGIDAAAGTSASSAAVPTLHIVALSPGEPVQKWKLEGDVTSHAKVKSFVENSLFSTSESEEEEEEELGSNTPLRDAARQGDSKAVKTLIAAGADVNQADERGVTPLYIAAAKGRVAVVKELLAAGADANQARTDNGETPLFVAAANGHLSIVKKLIAAGADVNARRFNDDDEVTWDSDEL